jgi:hypothetical protein
MRARYATGAPESLAPFWLRLARALLLVLPVGLLVAITLRSSGSEMHLLWLGTLFQALACTLALVTRRGLWEPLGPVLIMLYVIALSWVLLGTYGVHDWLIHLAQALLLVVPLGLFSVQCLYDSGAVALRRARQLAQRLVQRRDWPADLQACRLLPEVKALRESLYLDASPALQMLASPRPEVRVAALAALEFRQKWQPGQPELVLHLAKHSPEPELRAAALNALANLDDRFLIEQLAELLYDPATLVRRTAVEALLWNTERRWAWLRQAARRTLAEPLFESDGPLCREGILLTDEAVNDLIGWCAEKGLVAVRSASTVAAHYQQVFSTCTDSKVVTHLRHRVLDPHAPPMLRLELAHLLRQQGQLDEQAQQLLLEPSSPTPLRLMAVDAMLARGPSHEAQGVLRDLARAPNREIALTIADMLQRRLGIHLGLMPGEPLPSLHSRQAAEVARRVFLWATHQEHAVTGGHTSDFLTPVSLDS